MPHSCSCGLHDPPASPPSALDAAVAAAAGVALRPELSAAVLSEMVATRRAVHQNPELSFREAQTAALVAARLRALPGYDVTEGIAPGHGVVATLRGGGGAGPTIALRADMDALPIQENADAAAGGAAPAREGFASRNAGVMHACGHDGHVAILLGVARALAESVAPAMRGAIKLIFQPAEEDAHPTLGAFGGAHEMVAAGVLSDDPAVEALYGLHLWSYLPAGVVAVSEGPVMAACDTFHLAVTGVGGHGATPHCCVDCVVVCAALVTALQTIVSRSHDPMERAVLTVASMQAGTPPNSNVIPQTGELHGTARTFSAAAQALTERRLREVCAGVGATYGATVEVTYEREAPAVVNDGAAAAVVAEAARKVCRAEGAVTAAQATMAAEDVSFFLNRVPGCFFFVGSAPGGEPVSHHKPEFDIDERALGVGASVLLQVVHDLLVA
jgi:amidohydrolase